MAKVELTNDQQQAEKMIEEWFLNTDNQVFVLSGYAGTGKTFLITRLVNRLHLQVGVEAVFVTPTGKAASVLIQNGMIAGTVHSLIYTRSEDDFEVDENGEIIRSEKITFIKRSSIDERIKLIVVDEASMISDETVADLLSFGVKCLFCGDNAQLPPVNGNSRLLNFPLCTLTEIVRQEAENPIIALSKRAREGEYIPYGSYGENVRVIGKNVLSKAERRRIFLEADQIICGRNKTRNELNEEIRWYKGISQEEKLPLDGEKVICTLNDWEKPLDAEGRFHLVNGVIGRVENVRMEEDFLATMQFTPDFIPNAIDVVFDALVFDQKNYAHFYGDRAVFLANGRVVHEKNHAVLRRVKAIREETISRFEFAYAITCHKAQGSEFDFVVVFDESWAFGEEKNKWLYTAITRAKKKLLIIR